MPNPSHKCIACPVEVRALYSTCFNFLNLIDEIPTDPDRVKRKLGERIMEIKRAVNALTPIVEKHFENSK